MALFEAADLAAYLQLTPLDVPEAPAPQPITDATYQVLHRVVTGWLTAATGLDPLPGADWSSTDEVPGALEAWAIELAAIAHQNPTAATSDSSGASSMAWNENRRQAILAAAARWAIDRKDVPDPVPSPSGSFPYPPRWPTDLDTQHRRRHRILND